jgi:hypothetical protein
MLDTDGDGLSNKVEVCKWGSNPANINTDGDMRGDCNEAFDINGNTLLTNADAILVLQAFFGVITGDWNFDVNANGTANAVDGILIAQAFFSVIDCA